MSKRADLVETVPMDISPYDRWLGEVSLAGTAHAIEADAAHLAVCALYDQADERRKAIKEPALRACQALDADWRKARKPIEKLRDHLAALLSDFEQAERAKAIELAKEKAQSMDDPARGQALVRLAEDTVAADLPHGKWLDDWEFEIEDVRTIPEALLTFNETAAKKLCRQGITDIPGVRVTMRRKRSARA